MFLRKELAPFPVLGAVSLSYFSAEQVCSDSGVCLYTRQKLSILLTDDLAAVIGNDVYNAVRGDFFVFTPEEIHHGRFLRSGLHRYLDFYIPPDFFDRPDLIAPGCLGEVDIMQPFRDRQPRVNLVHPDEADRRSVLVLAERAAALVQAHPDEDDHTVDLLLFAVMIELMSVCAQAWLRQKAQPAASCVPAVVSKAIAYINEHYAEDVPLAVLSSVCGCSVAYLTRAFGRYTGKTPHVYLRERRLAAAQRLLREGATVTEACYGAGFGDCTSFIRTFRRYAGMTPGEYARQL